VPRLLGRSFAGGRIRKEKKTKAKQSKARQRKDQTSQSVSQSVSQSNGFSLKVPNDEYLTGWNIV
jgi:hypothetical protein